MTPLDLAFGRRPRDVLTPENAEPNQAATKNSEKKNGRKNVETAPPKHTIGIRHNRIVVEVLTRPMG